MCPVIEALGLGELLADGLRLAEKDALGDKLRLKLEEGDSEAEDEGDTELLMLEDGLSDPLAEADGLVEALVLADGDVLADGESEALDEDEGERLGDDEALGDRLADGD